MKIATILFAFFVLLMSVKPDLTLELLQISDCSESCCDYQSPEMPDEKGCNDANPFQNCCSACIGFINASQGTGTLFNPVKQLSLPEYYEYAYFQFSGDVWQPPKLS